MIACGAPALGLLRLGAPVQPPARRASRCVDLALFRLGSFTWGVILAAVAVLAMIGVLFTLPQYFQGVLGTDAMGSGLRLLPLIGGLVLGAVPAARIGPAGRREGRGRARVRAARGRAAASGPTTSVSSRAGFAAAGWPSPGSGWGWRWPPPPRRRSPSCPGAQRSRSAVLQAINKIGGPLGTADPRERAELRLPRAVARWPGCRPRRRRAVRQRSSAQSRSRTTCTLSALLASSRLAFVHGMDRALLVSCLIAGGGVVLALAFLPGTRATESELRPAGNASEPITAG